MALTIFLCGHGSWKPGNGFFQMPNNCSMTFMVQHAKLLPTTDMFRICEGTYPAEPDRIVGEQGSVVRSCPNMTWTRDEPGKISICDKALMKNGSVGTAQVLFPNHLPNFLDKTGSLSLKKFFEEYWPNIGRQLTQIHGSVNFIWNCCSHVALKPSKFGADIGVNAGQSPDQFVHLDLRGGKLVPTGDVTRR